MQTVKFVFRWGMFLFLACALWPISSVLGQEKNQWYTIEAQILQSALDEYQKFSGRNLAYSDSLVRDKKSKGVQGQHTDAQALSKILEGTGLQVVTTAKGTLALTALSQISKPEGNLLSKQKEKDSDKSHLGKMQLKEVVVTATKTPVKTKEVPATVNVILDQDIKLRANTDNFADAISILPGIRVVRGGDDRYSIYTWDESFYPYQRARHEFFCLVDRVVADRHEWS